MLHKKGSLRDTNHCCRLRAATAAPNGPYALIHRNLKHLSQSGSAQLAPCCHRHHCCQKANLEWDCCNCVSLTPCDRQTLLNDLRPEPLHAPSSSKHNLLTAKEWSSFPAVLARRSRRSLKLMVTGGCVTLPRYLGLSSAMHLVQNC